MYNIDTEYPGQVTPGAGDMPFGNPRNVSAPSAGDGTPWEQRLAKDFYGWMTALMVLDGAVPGGSQEEAGHTLGAAKSQILQALINLSNKVASYIIHTIVGNTIINQQFSAPVVGIGSTQIVFIQDIRVDAGLMTDLIIRDADAVLIATIDTATYGTSPSNASVTITKNNPKLPLYMSTVDAVTPQNLSQLSVFVTYRYSAEP